MGCANKIIKVKTPPTDENVGGAFGLLKIYIVVSFNLYTSQQDYLPRQALL